MFDLLYKVVYVVSPYLGLITAVCALYHILQMFSNVRKEKSFISNFLGPLVIFVSFPYTEKGNHHRKLFMLFALLSVGLWMLTFAMHPQVVLNPGG
jgi:hypothetical protein